MLQHLEWLNLRRCSGSEEEIFLQGFQAKHRYSAFLAACVYSCAVVARIFTVWKLEGFEAEGAGMVIWLVTECSSALLMVAFTCWSQYQHHIQSSFPRLREALTLFVATSAIFSNFFGCIWAMEEGHTRLFADTQLEVVLWGQALTAGFVLLYDVRMQVGWIIPVLNFVLSSVALLIARQPRGPSSIVASLIFLLLSLKAMWLLEGTARSQAKPQQFRSSTSHVPTTGVVPTSPATKTKPKMAWAAELRGDGETPEPARRTSFTLQLSKNHTVLAVSGEAAHLVQQAQNLTIWSIVPVHVQDKLLRVFTLVEADVQLVEMEVPIATGSPAMHLCISRAEGDNPEAQWEVLVALDMKAAEKGISILQPMRQTPQISVEQRDHGGIASSERRGHEARPGQNSGRSSSSPSAQEVQYPRSQSEASVQAAQSEVSEVSVQPQSDVSVLAGQAPGLASQGSQARSSSQSLSSSFVSNSPSHSSHSQPDSDSSLSLHYSSSDLAEAPEDAAAAAPLRVCISTHSQTEAASVSETGTSTSISWDLDGWHCRNCIKPPLLPGTPRGQDAANALRDAQKQRKRDAKRQIQNKIHARPQQSPLDGTWELEDDFKALAHDWLQSLCFSGSQVIDHTGQTWNLERGPEKTVTLAKGTLVLCGADVLHRIGRSGVRLTYRRAGTIDSSQDSSALQGPTLGRISLAESSQISSLAESSHSSMDSCKRFAAPSAGFNREGTLDSEVPAGSSLCVADLWGQNFPDSSDEDAVDHQDSGDR